MVVDSVARRAKRELRIRLLAERARRPVADRKNAADALCARVSAIPEVPVATRIACYASTPQEPGTRPLLATLSAGGCDVLLPTLQADFDLGWATYEPGALVSARFGIKEPTGVPLGVDAVSDASVVICPGLAGDAQGHRLGRGGGSYDRALSRVDRSVLRVMLLYDDEVLDVVPTDDHDERVHLIVTPTRSVWTLFSRET